MPGSYSFYCPPTKLREGNVFTGVCHYVQLGGGPHMTITHDVLNLTLQTPTDQALPLQTWGPSIPGLGTPSRHETWGPHPLVSNIVTSGGHHWIPVHTCSFDLTVQPPLHYWHLVDEVHTVGKRAVRILLECCFVMTNIFSTWIQRIQMIHLEKTQMGLYERTRIAAKSSNIWVTVLSRWCWTKFDTASFKGK